MTQAVKFTLKLKLKNELEIKIEIEIEIVLHKSAGLFEVILPDGRSFTMPAGVYSFGVLEIFYPTDMSIDLEGYLRIDTCNLRNKTKRTPPIYLHYNSTEGNLMEAWSFSKEAPTEPYIRLSYLPKMVFVD